MSKQQVVWLIVRLVGVYFAYLAVVTAFSLPGAVSTLYSLSSRPTAAKPEIENVRPTPYPGFPKTENETQQAGKTDPAAENLKSEAFKTLLKYIFFTALYGGIGFYLIRRGRLLFNVLINETSAKAYEDNPAVTTLKL